MGIKASLSKPFARFIKKQVLKSAQVPVFSQEKEFEKLLSIGKNTRFGKEHKLEKVNSYEEFKKSIPLRDYEDFKPYIDCIMEGEKNVLWKGSPLYMSKTSGTTSGIKYIPITKESMPNHMNSARNTLLMYIANTGNPKFVNGKMIFLSGSPQLDKKNGLLIGRLSGIVNHHIPNYLRKNKLPSYETNCIEDWEQKLDAIVEETYREDMTLISGIPPWVQMYFERLYEKTGKKVKELFPNFQVFVHGGVNFEPYKAKMEETIGGKVDYIETYPASEGFIAYQDTREEHGLLLILNSGIFYEFIPAEEIFDDNPTRISLKDVELGVNYAIILNTNAGLWGYNIGDTVRFVSKDPYRLKVTGRVKHFISALGEHVIVEEVEDSILKAASEENIDIIEFTVAPVYKKGEESAFHEWLVEFGRLPVDIEGFSKKVDKFMQEKNIYYKDLREGNMLENLKIEVLEKDAFRNYMKSKGKLGGQNKVPRLSNDRNIADELKKYIKTPETELNN